MVHFLLYRPTKNICWTNRHKCVVWIKEKIKIKEGASLSYQTLAPAFHVPPPLQKADTCRQNSHTLPHPPTHTRAAQAHSQTPTSSYRPFWGGCRSAVNLMRVSFSIFFLGFDVFHTLRLIRRSHLGRGHLSGSQAVSCERQRPAINLT